MTSTFPELSNGIWHAYVHWSDYVCEWKQSDCVMCFGRESQKEPGYGIFHVKYSYRELTDISLVFDNFCDIGS